MDDGIEELSLWNETQLLSSPITRTGVPWRL
jgi:hypothetical protein